MKNCPKCNVVQPLGAFFVRPNGRPQSHCKACGNLRAVAWVKTNAEKAAATGLRYREANRELIAERARLRRAANPDAARQSVAKWRAANSEAACRASRAWAAANPVKARAQEAKRRAMKLQAVATWADHDLIADIYAYAKAMRDAGIDCHVDHIVPLQGKTVCGLHTHDNLTVLLARDNLVKGNRFAEL